jgi:hypothetical protein
MQVGIERSGEEILQEINRIHGAEPLVDAFRNITIPDGPAYPLTRSLGLVAELFGDKSSATVLRLDRAGKPQFVLELYQMMPRLIADDLNGEIDPRVSPLLRVSNPFPRSGVYTAAVSKYDFYPKRGYSSHLSDLVVDAQVAIRNSIDRYLNENF